MRYVNVLFLFIVIPALGQTAAPDSSFAQLAKQQAIRTYEQAMTRQEHVYEGNEYISHDHRIKVHPYYPIDSLLSGTIAYNGATYYDVRMLYDIVRDEVSVQPPEGAYRLRLHPEKVGRFSIGQHQFIRLAGDSTSALPTGFYEVLYNGKTDVLAHRVKTVHEDISSGAYKAEYLIKDRFYVQKKGMYEEVKTKRSVLSLFPDQAKALRRYIRTNNIKFKEESREAAITGVVRQYDDLTH